MMKKLDAREADLQLTKLENDLDFKLKNEEELAQSDIEEVLDFARECISLLDVYEDTIDFYKNVINNITEQINELP